MKKTSLLIVFYRFIIVIAFSIFFIRNQKQPPPQCDSDNAQAKYKYKRLILHATKNSSQEYGRQDILYNIHKPFAEFFLHRSEDFLAAKVMKSLKFKVQSLEFFLGKRAFSHYLY